MLQMILQTKQKSPRLSDTIRYRGKK